MTRNLPKSGETDAEFIAHARQDIPDLLTALSAAEAKVRELEAALREAVGALKGCDGIIADAQMILADYLQPDGRPTIAAINRLIELMDGPHQRKVADDTSSVLARTISHFSPTPQKAPTDDRA